MNKFSPVYLLCAILLFSVFSIPDKSLVIADQGKDEWKPRFAERSAEKLANGDVNVATHLRMERRRLIQSCISTLQAQIRDNELDANMNGSTYTLITILADYRARQAVPVLLDLVDFQIREESFSIGISYKDEAHFPAASALREIGGIEVMEGVLQNIEESDDSRVHHLSLWILSQVARKETAKVLLEARMSELEPGVEKQAKLEEALAKLSRTEHLAVFPRKSEE